jgi:multidrug efflux pump subunit AcrA (membrane-fusion protein)
VVEQALHQYEKAQAEQRLYAVKLESCRILAPFDGVVTEKVAQMHEVAQPNQPLIKIINQSRVELVMMVPSAWLPRLSGAAFPVKIDETGLVHQARVLQSTGLIDPVSQTSRVIAELTGPAHDVLPGMSGVADLGRIAR